MTTATGQLKRELTEPELAAILKPLGIPKSVEPINDGLFARAARVQLDDGSVVAVKSSPSTADAPILSYEHSIMDAEIEVLRIGGTNPQMRLPQLRLVDDTRSVVDAAVMATAFLPGKRWDMCAAKMSKAARWAAEYEVGRVLGGFASVSGDRYGYVSDRAPAFTSGNWATTFRAMVQSVLDDGERGGVDLEPAQVLAALDRHDRVLRSVTSPRLVHGDLCAGNVFVNPKQGTVTGVIDPERALWGDPVFDIAGVHQMSVADPSAPLLAGLGEGGVTVTLTEDVQVRLNLYRMWFAIAMLAEGGIRGHLFDDLAGREPALRGQLAATLGLL